MHVHGHVHVSASMCEACLHVCVCLHTCMQSYVVTYIQGQGCVCVYTTRHMPMPIGAMLTYMYHVRTESMGDDIIPLVPLRIEHTHYLSHANTPSMYVHTHVYIHIHVMCMRVHVCVCVCMCMCTCACGHVCMYMHTHMHGAHATSNGTAGMCISCVPSST